MLNRDDLHSLIHLQLPEAEAADWLSKLTPEQVTPQLLRDALSCLQETALPVAQPSSPVIDCCGTGGSGLSHFNTSTTAAFVLAAGGIPVVKFGNRGFSSACGSFDLLEQLGIPAQVDLQRVPELLDKCNLLFLFAPACYPRIAAFSQLRRKLKTRTLFNFLGPLLNPVQPAYRMLGVSNAHMQTLMADYLAEQPFNQHSWLAHGQNGLDEIALNTSTRILSVRQGQVQEQIHQPDSVQNILQGGLQDTSSTDFQSPEALEHSPADNFAIFNSLISGQDAESPYYQMVCLNAAAGFLVTGKANTLADGIREAQALFRSGEISHTVERCRSTHAQFAH